MTCAPAPAEQATTGTAFDPGNIISDAVFYNTASMTVEQIRVFLRSEGEGCVGSYCLKNLTLTTPDQPADRYCAAYQGGTNEDAATVISKFSTACGISPQVMLVTLQKESGLLSRTDTSAGTYNAAWGWHCPDTGPGGSANCDPAYAGFFNQGYGMAKQWSRYRLDPDKYNYRAGQTVDILWNVVESGCGSAPVTIQNTATASLYIYTPYQPNAAVAGRLPRHRRRLLRLRQPQLLLHVPQVLRIHRRRCLDDAPPRCCRPGPRSRSRTTSTSRPPSPDRPSPPRTPRWPPASPPGSPRWACPTSGAAAAPGPARTTAAPAVAATSTAAAATIGFDCSGLTAYVLGMAGYQTPGDSGSQRSSGTSISWAEALPGDIVGFPGHVAIYLGTFGGIPYILEASWVGTPIHIVPLTRTDVDDRVHRYWTGPAVRAPGVADFGAVVRGYTPLMTGNSGTSIYSGWTGAGSSSGSTPQRIYSSTIPRLQPRPWPAPVTQTPPAPVVQAPVAAGVRR